MRIFFVGLSPAILAVAACQPKMADLPPQFTVTPEELDFETVPTEGEATLELTLENAGGGEVALLSVTLTEGDPDTYEVDRNGVEIIGAEEQQIVLVTFRPDEERLYTGQLQLRTDYPEQASFYVTLLGQGGPSQEDYDQDGFSAAAGDCDDGNAAVHPDAEEVCDGVDNNCDSIRLPDEVDADYDGWFVCTGDCDDANGAINPGQAEQCDGLDNNCDDEIPDNDDGDSDGYTLCDGDCDDAVSQVNPGRPEICDGYDNDCDTNVDNVDNDGDGHTVCSAAGDCDDTDPNAYPVVVSEAGSSYGDGTDSNPYDTIDLALANLDTVCRTVVLEPGSYEVDETWTGGLVTLMGRTGNPAEVTLIQDYYTGNRLFTVEGGELVLRDLTLSGSVYAYDGGAISVTAASLELDGVVFTGNQSYNDGGAIAAVSSTLSLHGGCRFEGNSAADDGGAMVLDSSTVTDEGTFYLANNGTRGGALFIAAGSVSLDDTEFRSNTAGQEGGAISANNGGTLQLERSLLVLNSATVDGGALVLRDFTGTGAVRNNRFQDNLAQNSGGAIAVLGASGLPIVNNTLTGNEAVSQGGAMAILGTTAGAMVVLANVSHSNDGLSAYYSESVPTFAYNTGYLTNSGTHFAGELVEGDTNVVQNPLLVALTDDGNPDNDDLALQGGSPEIDTGPEDAAYNDRNGTRNDRGFTGGPASP
jgi:predicted outer membrane repeat protein